MTEKDNEYCFGITLGKKKKKGQPPQKSNSANLIKVELTRH